MLPPVLASLSGVTVLHPQSTKLGGVVDSDDCSTHGVKVADLCRTSPRRRGASVTCISLRTLSPAKLVMSGRRGCRPRVTVFSVEKGWWK